MEEAREQGSMILAGKLKLRFCEKDTKFLKNHPLIFVHCSNAMVKSKVKILQNFGAFSEHMNFMGPSLYYSRTYGLGIGVKVTQRRSLSNIKTKNLDKAKGLGSLASRGGTDFDK